MQVSDISLMTGQDNCQLQAVVQTARSAEPFLLWFRFPAAFAGQIDAANGDPFVLALLQPAMRLGEPLEIPAPISSRLACSVPDLQAIYRLWDPSLTLISVAAVVRRETYQSMSLPPRVGLFFSLGVDSFYSLLKNCDQHSDDDETITDLITVNGFDIAPSLGNASLFPTVLENSRKVGKALSKTVLPVTTNLRELSDRYQINWLIHSGAAMASVGLALEGACRKIWVAGAYPYAYFWPDGTNPLFGPLWSTERLTFVIDGCTTTKMGKMRYISASTLVQETLRVCWENPGNAYNCGRCGKCLQTMIGLHVTGVLSKCKTFPSSIDTRLISTLVAPTYPVKQMYKELISGLGRSETDLRIRAALESHLGGENTGQPLSERESFQRQLAAEGAVAAQANKVNTLVAQVAERQKAVESLGTQMAAQTEKVNSLVAQVAERQQAVQALAMQLAEKEDLLHRLNGILNAIYGSKWWQVGALFHRVNVRIQSLGKSKRESDIQSLSSRLEK